MQSPLPVLALLCNALLWGLSWWPFRSMHAAGLHPLWATAVMYTLVCAVMLAARPGSLGDLLRQTGHHVGIDPDVAATEHLPGELEQDSLIRMGLSHKLSQGDERTGTGRRSLRPRLRTGRTG